MAASFWAYLLSSNSDFGAGRFRPGFRKPEGMSSNSSSPVSGQISERNEQVIDNPQLVNDNPYEAGWMLKVELSDSSQLDKLLDAAQYEAFLAAQE